jgi:hypothetical protein
MGVQGTACGLAAQGTTVSLTLARDTNTSQAHLCICRNCSLAWGRWVHVLSFCMVPFWMQYTGPFRGRLSTKPNGHTRVWDLGMDELLAYFGLVGI